MPTDSEFVSRLDGEVMAFLRAIDAWEQAYVKYYRLVAPESVSSDLEKLHANFVAARRTLQGSIPRARRMCIKHGLRDPFPGVLHVVLGSNAPQSSRYSPALGRSERDALLDCVHEMGHAVLDERLPRSEPQAAVSRSWWRRIIDFFV